MLTLHLSIVFLLIVVNGLILRWPRLRSWPQRNALFVRLRKAATPAAQAALELHPSRLLATVQIRCAVIASLSLSGTFRRGTLGDPLQAALESQEGLASRGTRSHQHGHRSLSASRISR